MRHFMFSERSLNKRYEKQIASWPYADKLESIETTQTNLGNYNPIMINFLPKYLRSRQAVDMLALYLERGQPKIYPKPSNYMNKISQTCKRFQIRAKQNKNLHNCPVILKYQKKLAR